MCVADGLDLGRGCEGRTCRGSDLTGRSRCPGWSSPRWSLTGHDRSVRSSAVFQSVDERDGHSSQRLNSAFAESAVAERSIFTDCRRSRFSFSRRMRASTSTGSVGISSSSGLRTQVCEASLWTPVYSAIRLMAPVRVFGSRRASAPSRTTCCEGARDSGTTLLIVRVNHYSCCIPEVGASGCVGGDEVDPRGRGHRYGAVGNCAVRA